VSCIVHETTAYPIFSCLPLNADNLVKNYMLKYGARGNNDFKDVMVKIREELLKNPPGYTPVALFMTDGVWFEDGASAELQSIMDQFSKLNFTLYTFALGPQINVTLMQNFAKIGKGIYFDSTINLEDFKSKYVYLAGLLE